MFHYAVNLESVMASSANLDFKNEKTRYLFKNLTKLQTIDLGHNGIETLPNYIFRDQNKSLYSLNLDNSLSSIPFTVSMLTNLSRLSVRYNRISSFQPPDISILNRLNKIKIFIEGNPISCTCSTLIFIEMDKRKPNAIWRLAKNAMFTNQSDVNTFFTRRNI
jgi:Leucine-rich repeat (LRR) protein